jgi:small-conductance mechanosensitive channel/CRP-like cAMP-binding protein
LIGLVEVLKNWTFAFLGLAVLVVAFLVNRFAHEKRRRVRRVVLIYVLYLAAIAGASVLRRLGQDAWADHLTLAGNLLESFTVINIVALLLFDLLLPAISFEVVQITSDVVVGVAYLFAGIGVLRAAGVNTSSVVATSAVVSAVLALSLQATLGNILGGIALQMDGSIHVGDWIQMADGRQGKVKEIRWRHTVVETRDWDTIIVPNANLLAQNIIIIGKREGQERRQHRMWVYFNIDFRFAPSHVIDVVRDALSSAPIEGVAEDPKPSVICYDFAKDGRDSFGYYAVRYWLTDLAADDPTSSRIRTRIYSALRRAGIPLAKPSQAVFFAPEDDERGRLERHRERQLRALTRVELFHPLTKEELSSVADRLIFAPFTAGETVTRAGAIAHWLYILVSGKVEVRLTVEGVSKVVATLEGPSFFGEMGLMTGDPRTADVIALTDIECYRLDKEAFERILHDRPEIANQMSVLLAHRRVDLEAIREGLSEEARVAREASEQSRILGRIQDFFGLDRTTSA